VVDMLDGAETGRRRDDELREVKRTRKAKKEMSREVSRDECYATGQ